MYERKFIIDIIYSAFDEINESLSKEKQLKKSEKSVIFGRNGNLDSLGLVNLIITVEQKIEKNIGKYVTLASENALSLDESPFNTVESLSKYILTLLDSNN